MSSLVISLVLAALTAGAAQPPETTRVAGRVLDDVALGRVIKGRQVTSRTSYVIARDGRIASVYSDMNPAEHVTRSLAAVHQLTGH